MSQVLTNLIGNAIKHHDRDRGQIDLTVKDCGRYYQLAIADDGPGIPEADRERIFEMFETLKNKTSTTNTGIGLALVKKIVLGEGGELWLDSKGDRGCKFCFSWKK
ncbi:MAG: sensor histidine kinase [Pleurocapsa sp. MO_226.B13]|nr:sensor histidine kinase [Pleurocapsa sp. MO_226.B13]